MARPQTAPEPATPAAPAVEAPARPSRMGFLRAIASDYKAIASLIGLLVYGVVRVAYDAFYTRLGVFPEAVGLSETTILGRAVLYLALTVSMAAIFGGLWLAAVAWSLERSRTHGRTTSAPVRSLLAGTIALCVVAVWLVLLGGELRSLLGSRHLVYYCFQRCKFASLSDATVAALRDIDQRNAQTHPDYRVVDVGPAWLVVVPVLILIAAAVAGLVLVRRRRRPGTPTLVLLFGAVAVGSAAASLLAPQLIAAANDAAQHGSGYVDTHPGFVKWGVFALLLVAVTAALLALLDSLVGAQAMRSPWLVASFVVALPLLVGFPEPNVPQFIAEEGLHTVAAAVVLLLALVLLSFHLWPQLRDGTVRPSAPFAVLLALVVSLTLLLAWARGLNLAEQAAMGDQVFAKRFSLLSVRANVVCLDPTEAGTKLALPRRPYEYLGVVGGTLVLYDYVSDLAHDVPTSFPVRIPASGVTVRLAKFDNGPGNPHGIAWAFWDCEQT